jgi:probable rRNA maturation factor
MVNVLFLTESHFPVQKKFVVDIVERALKGRANGNVEVGVTIVGDRRMKELNKTYRNIDDTTDVLSFPLNDPTQAQPHPFAEPPDGVLRLGDVIVSYPQVVQEATDQNKMVDDVLAFLIEHGLNHLLGIHHPE